MPLRGDFTGDGFVNAADLNILALNWQMGVDDLAGGPAVSFNEALAASSIVSVVIPEPGMATLLTLAAMATLPRSRKRSQSS